MVKYGTRDDLVWTCMFDKFDSGTLLYNYIYIYIHHFTWPTWASKSKSLFRSATVPRFLAPTRVGLLRHVADKTVPAAASASPSPFVSFDYGGVINLYQPTRLQDITRYYKILYTIFFLVYIWLSPWIMTRHSLFAKWKWTPPTGGSHIEWLDAADKAGESCPLFQQSSWLAKRAISIRFFSWLKSVELFRSW